MLLLEQGILFSNGSNFHKNDDFIGSYEYHINKLISNDKDILPENIRNDIKIDETTITNLKDEGYNSIVNSIITAFKQLIEYIEGIDREIPTKERDNVVNETIIRDINKFYDLFDTRDEYYMNYLKK